MLRNNNCIVWIALLACLATNARADTYVFTDENGIENFSDEPVDVRYRLYMTESGAVGRVVASKFATEIKQAAASCNVDEALLQAVITTESADNPYAKSKRGALGLMQLMPATARNLGVADVFDPAQNITAGSRHLKRLLVKFDNNLKLALAAYNAGEGEVIRHGRQIPPYPETAAYVSKVMRLYNQYRSEEK